jgi:hypothetical protein
MGESLRSKAEFACCIRGKSYISAPRPLFDFSLIPSLSTCCSGKSALSYFIRQSFGVLPAREGYSEPLA